MQPGMPKSNESCNTANPLYIEGGTITTARRAVKKGLGKDRVSASDVAQVTLAAERPGFSPLSSLSHAMPSD